MACGDNSSERLAEIQSSVCDILTRLTSTKGCSLSDAEFKNKNLTLLSLLLEKTLALGGQGALNNPTVKREDASDSNINLVLEDSTRKFIVLYNDSDYDAYVKLGETASYTDFSYKILAGGHLELTNVISNIDAIWETGATGAMQITELF